ncbi:Hypothetical protein PMT_2545 [Prochlorococcus marinus str. MIT 9313]|uniref:Uncharacterized protein n=1 Tax=Prochlorococcus marinus (strain MIT 9313) TaxID=74547 RepID=B9ERK9_PROMM|nr:Hypothetical protein PMT_2545 [Prochlorococcus marinus str. MIT 9313]
MAVNGANDQLSKKTCFYRRCNNDRTTSAHLKRVVHSSCEIVNQRTNKIQHLRSIHPD